MSEPIKCFLLVPTERVRQWIYRETWSTTPGTCPAYPDGFGHMSEEIEVEDWFVALKQEEYDPGSTSGDFWHHDDPRYPLTCKCGYEFKEGDDYVVRRRRVWKDQESGRESLLALGDTPPGAIWWATWQGKHDWDGSSIWRERGGGPHLHVMTPAGIADLDATASNGPGWFWQGVPPNVTATPSIWIQGEHGWHGWLRDGALVEV